MKHHHGPWSKVFKYDAEAIEYALAFAREHNYHMVAYGWEDDRFVIHFA